jgi:hypothetical protein
MRQYTPGLTLAGIAVLLLTACGGGGGSSSSSSSGGAANVVPVANAGANQTVNSGVTVTLNGTASSDSDGSIASYTWNQTAGTPAVILASGATAQPTFPAPTVVATTTLTFSLVVTDNRGGVSPASTVTVTINPTVNVAPTANAGSNQTVASGVTVTLNGSASSDPDGSIASYAWTQTAGTPAVTLASATTAQPTFVAPTVAMATTFTFSLVVSDNGGAASSASTVNVVVNPPVAGNVNVTGQITFGRVPFATAFPNGLNYAAPVQQPSRGVVVEALAAGTSTVLTSTITDSVGNYTLVVANNTNISIRVSARMVRNGSPQWDVRVQDGVPGTNPYSYTEPGSFSSGAGIAHNVAIPTGINAAGVATGTRASGPFAVLDTIYQGIQTILGVAPSTNFPMLVVDWGSQTDGTFFSGGGSQHIALLADLTEDTDEFDQHVIAHEFGHYIEFNFSRADNIGGAHGLGDKLDPRVAFGEGFGYAFAGIVLNNPIARDSFVDGTTQRSGRFDIEANPPTNPVGAPNNDFGCWCSESSVWSILWDIHDNVADTNDTLALGFQPIWNVLVGPQATTPAFTTIFSFITALKAQNAGSVSAINTLVAAQNINSANIDAFGTNETFVPPPLLSGPTLPVYALATIGGGAIVLATSNDANSTDPTLPRHNKLGNRRFIRFNVPTTRSVTITASSSNTNNPDTDFLVWRAGTFVVSATAPPASNETATFNAIAGDYVIDLFDCANGCDTPEGTSGDYNLTVTIN